MSEIEQQLKLLKRIYQKIRELEKENARLKIESNNEYLRARELFLKNEKLELALDKACGQIESCPPITCTEIVKIITNDSVCKECWKKYFMKEVAEDD